MTRENNWLFVNTISLAFIPGMYCVIVSVIDVCVSAISGTCVFLFASLL